MDFDVLTELQDVHKSLETLVDQAKLSRSKEYFTVACSSTQPWILNYYGRKHLFFWLPSTQTMSFEDYGTGSVQGQVWINVGIPSSTRAYITSSTTLMDIFVCATDEVIP